MWRKLAIAILVAWPGWVWAAGVGHYYIPASAFRVYEPADKPASCKISTFTGEFRTAANAPDRSLFTFSTAQSATNCLMYTEIWYPESHVDSSVTFTPKLYITEGESTKANTACFKVTYSVAASPTTSAWYSTPSAAATAVTGSYAMTGTADAEGTISFSSMTPYRVTGAGGANCSGTNCENLPGILLIERCECGQDAGCPAGTDSADEVHGFGFDLSWVTP